MCRVDATNGNKCKRWRGDPERFPVPNALANSNPTLQFFHPHPSLPTQRSEKDGKERDPSGKEGDKTDVLGCDWDVLRSAGPIISQMKANGQFTVWLSWSLPPTEHLYAEKPLFYLRYMIGYGGRDSLEK